MQRRLYVKVKFALRYALTTKNSPAIRIRPVADLKRINMVRPETLVSRW